MGLHLPLVLGPRVSAKSLVGGSVLHPKLFRLKEPHHYHLGSPTYPPLITSPPVDPEHIVNTIVS